MNVVSAPGDTAVRVEQGAAEVSGSVRGAVEAAEGGEGVRGNAEDTVAAGIDGAPAPFAVLATAVSPLPGNAPVEAVTGDRVRAVLDAFLGDGVGIRWDRCGGTVWWPVAGPFGHRFDDVVAVLAAQLGVRLTAAVVIAPHAELSDGARLAHELLEVVHRLRRDPGLYRFDDLALEYQLTRPGPGRERLAARLAPLGGHPELWNTLRAYLAYDHKRARTARALRVHPNTVDNRLKRIAQLTGLDPLEPEGMWCLRSALLVCAYRDGAAPS